MIKLGIVDDHQIVINGLTKLLDNSKIEVVFQSTKPVEIIIYKGLLEIDVLLIDIEMPEINGFQLSEKLLALVPDLKILVLTMYDEEGLIQKAKQIGVKGYLSKNIDEQLLIECVQEIHEGGTRFAASSNTNKSNFNKQETINQTLIEELSKREFEILDLVVQGLNNHEIGDKLFVSHRTVDTHRTNIMRKLKVSNVVSLVRIALNSGRFV